jgi:hypothetical protein
MDTYRKAIVAYFQQPVERDALLFSVMMEPRSHWDMTAVDWMHEEGVL